MRLIGVVALVKVAAPTWLVVYTLTTVGFAAYYCYIHRHFAMTNPERAEIGTISKSARWHLSVVCTAMTSAALTRGEAAELATEPQKLIGEIEVTADE